MVQQRFVDLSAYKHVNSQKQECWEISEDEYIYVLCMNFRQVIGNVNALSADEIYILRYSINI